MIRLKDIMLPNPPVLYNINTVGQAKIVASHSKIKSIPVIYPSREFAGTLDKELVLQERLSVKAPVANYLESVISLNADDSVTALAELPLETMSSVMPVLSEEGYLVGVIPNPKFFREIYSEVIRIFESCFADGIADLMKYGIIIIDDEGKIICFNTGAENILGIKGKDIYGLHVNKVLHDSRLYEVVKKGTPHLKARMQANQIVLCTNRFPLYKDGVIVGAIGIFEDNSENEQLHKSLRRLRGLNLEMVGILESMDDGLVVMDSYGKVLRINSAYETITGLSANQVLQANIDQLIDWGCLPALVLSEVLIKKKTLHIIEEIKGRDFLYIANPIFNGDGKTNRIVVILKDIGYLNELVLNLQVTHELAARYYHEMEKLKGYTGKDDMVASSNAMKRVVSLAQKVAQVDSNILITGETGVGKEVVALSIHKCSHRMDGPFIKLNCGAIPEPLLESELFGYEAGAFTGANKEGKAGLIEAADRGSLFLDEVADLPLNLQVKLLRVLQEREVMRVGSTKSKKVDFRLIAATNKDLEKMVNENAFREDLFYRLNVIPVEIPPLRERKEDIVPLIIFFLNKFNKKYNLTKKISPEVIQSLIKHDWPGNIRELENTIERLVVTCDGNVIVNFNLAENTRISNTNEKAPKLMYNVVEETEKQLIYQALEKCRTTREMADILGISQSAVVKKMKRYGIAKSRA